MTAPISPRRPQARRGARALLLAIVLCLTVPALALAHAVVYPKTSNAGGYEKYVIRVPNEKAVPTVRIEIHFPADLRVTSFSEVAGWQITVLTDSAKRITGAVWTGSLAPQRFIEFPFVAANPKTQTKLVWPIYQTYLDKADSMRVEWTGPEGSKTPASATTIGPSKAAADSAAAAAPTNGGGAARWVPWTALVLAVISLGLSLRPSDKTAS